MTPRSPLAIALASLAVVLAAVLPVQAHEGHDHSHDHAPAAALPAMSWPAGAGTLTRTASGAMVLVHQDGKSVMEMRPDGLMLMLDAQGTLYVVGRDGKLLTRKNATASGEGRKLLEHAKAHKAPKADGGHHH